MDRPRGDKGPSQSFKIMLKEWPELGGPGVKQGIKVQSLSRKKEAAMEHLMFENKARSWKIGGKKKAAMGPEIGVGCSGGGITKQKKTGDSVKPGVSKFIDSSTRSRGRAGKTEGAGRPRRSR